MTWKDIKLATLQKMYSAQGANIPTDDSTTDYVAGMPYVANEGLQMICTGKKYLVHSVSIENDGTGSDYGQSYGYPMKDIVDDFFEFYGEIYRTNNGYRNRVYLQTESEDVLLIPKDAEGTYTVYYKAYPETIDAITEDSHVLNIPSDVLAILPLYMASQLYKEDDNGIATSLRNEYEVAYERLSQNNPHQRSENFESGW